MDHDEEQALLIERNPTPAPADERESLLGSPGFGRFFTDHMVATRYSADRGWHGGKIEARAALRQEPQTAVLHYAQEVFEGVPWSGWIATGFLRARGPRSMFGRS